MDVGVKQKVIIGIIVVCLAVAIGVTVSSFSRGGGVDGHGPVPMLCVSPDCGKGYEISEEDFLEKVREIAAGSGGGLGQLGRMPPTSCPHCGGESGYTAIKCRCGKIYIPDPSVRTRYSDRCPECGYSAFEEQKKGSNR